VTDPDPSASPGGNANVRRLRPLDEVVAEESGRSSRRRWLIVLGVVAAVGGIAAGVAVLVRGKEVPMAERFTTAEVGRGELQAEVSATGRVEARSMVDVGAEVSGRVAAVEVDFDDHVDEGQVLVRFDTESLQAQVDQARASLKSAQATLRQARVDRKRTRSQLARIETLHARGVESDESLETAQLAAEAADAQVFSASAQVNFQRASLALAETSLDKAVVTAPIAGIVISRNVDPGQTVAAAFQTPVLLTIAEDLTKMRVTAGIDEADIASVHVGQPATFTVDAYPGREFDASVTELRNAPTVIQNVVSYDAVVEFDNPDLALKPGMTASVRVSTSSVSDALLVPNAALRFLPPEQQAGDETGVWRLEDETLVRVPVTAGVTDGRNTAIEGGTLAEGDPLLVGLTEQGRKAYGLTDGRKN
jgi:HlyD family secretion protein